jgi:hypothetical protein
MNQKEQYLTPARGTFIEPEFQEQPLIYVRKERG